MTNKRKKEHYHVLCELSSYLTALFLLLLTFDLCHGITSGGGTIQNRQAETEAQSSASVDPVLIMDDPGTARRPIRHDQNAPPGTSSLAFVFDVTGSMYDDLVQVREGAKRIFATVLAQREKLIYNYVLVPFHDPEVGPYVATSDTQYFQRKLQNLYVQGGGDCPEMAVSGIQMALEASLPASFIYVFTDARAKDYHLTDKVLNLIQEKQSQVVFVMTGDCGNRSHPGYKAFEKIASTSSGQIFHLEKSDVNEVLNYVRIIVQTRKVSIASLDREAGGTHILNLPIDSHLYEFTVSLSGDDPHIQLADPQGNRVTEGNGLKPVLNLGNVVVYNVKTPKPGMWMLRSHCKSKHTVRVTGIGGIDFTHGFAPRSVDSIEKTHNRPLQGVMSHLYVNMTTFPGPSTVNLIELIDLQGRTLYSAPALLDKSNPYLYSAGPLLPPDGYYFIKVNGIDDRNNEFQRISLTAINPQVAAGPKAYVPSKYSGLKDESVNLSCAVESSAPFTLYWYKGDEKISGPLFFRYSDTATLLLSDLDFADSGEYSCVVISASGNFTTSTYLETKEAPPRIIAPKNVSAILQSTAYLHCRAHSSGTGTITWQRRGVPLKSTEHFRVHSNGTLSISSVSRNDEGPYVCHVITGGGDARATIHLFVQEPPSVEVSPQSFYFADRGSFNISCAANGDPKPEVQWFFENEQLRPTYKHYITYKNDLLVRGATRENAGTYECKAISPAGRASSASVGQLALPPEVHVPRDRETIGRGDSVTLECQVTGGTPSPTVTWYRGGREITAFRYITVNGGRLSIQGAQDTDAGLYSCLVENMAGRAEGHIRVDVGSTPSIVPAPESVPVNIERDVTLHCRATGHPTPEITWRKGNRVLQHSAKYTTLPDGSLLIRGVEIEDGGKYVCVATNRFGSDQAYRDVLVTGLTSPVLGNVPPEEQVIEGRSLRLNCIVVLGTPKPTITWLKDNRPLTSGHNVQVQGDGSGLYVRQAQVGDEGRYTCVASSAAGNASLNIDVTVITKPVIQKSPVKSDLTVREGERLELPCRAVGKPPPIITWTRNNRPLFTSSPEYTLLPNGNLLLHKASAQEIGQYVCTAINPAGETTKRYTINVQSVPVIQSDQTNYSVLQDNRVTMKCTAVGLPKPKVTWYFKNRKADTVPGIQQQADGSITVHIAKEDHKGEYKCVAENGVGSDRRLVYLNVHTAPVIDGSGEVKVVTVRVNDTVRFPCPARADPPPHREWSYEDRRLSAGNLHGGEMRIAEGSEMELARVQMKNAGRYTCIVSNIAGNDSISYILRVEEPPKILFTAPDKAEVVKSARLELPCSVSGTPPPLISWQKDGFEIISGDEFFIGKDGTLTVKNSLKSHDGRYTCTARNSVGFDSKTTAVFVQEPPEILDSTVSEYDAVDGDRLVMKCFVYGTPTPKIVWYKRSLEIVKGANEDMDVMENGDLVIHSVKESDHGPYACKAVNPAGEVTKDMFVKVTVLPIVKEPDVVPSESAMLGSPFTLYCPVYSMPIPEITWYLNDRVIVEGDVNLHFSPDKRRLDVLKARPTDAGVYKCTAKNAAGQSSKMFKVEVLTPPSLDDTKFKRQINVVQNQSISLSCPVQGLPSPTVNWLINGQLLQNGSSLKGLKLSNDGREVHMQSAQVDHEGSYTCVATNKAGSLDVDIMLTVLVPPNLGDDEVIEVKAGSVVTVNCIPKDERLKSTFTWIKENEEAENSANNIQIALEGRKLYINKAQLNNEGLYTCIVKNSAGESHKNTYVRVLVPPKFKEATYEANVRVTSGQPLTLSCAVFGNPAPEVVWEKDGVELSPNNILSPTFSEDGYTLKIPDMSNGQKSRFTCTAKNKAGLVSRDFFVDTIAPPVLGYGSDRTHLETNRGSSVMMECPVSAYFTDYEILWSKNGRSVLESNGNAQVSADQQRLHLTHVQEEDEGVYTCSVRNPAGEASREFQLSVLSPPVLIGNKVERIEIFEGGDLTLRCSFESELLPDVTWTKDGQLPSAKMLILADNVTMHVSNVGHSDSGTYFCQVKNKAGRVEKTFHIRVVLKPRIAGSSADTMQEVELGQPVTLDCLVDDHHQQNGIEIEWLKDNLPVSNNDVQILSKGRHLRIVSAKRTDMSRYTCIAKNKAGSTFKSFNLVVLVPPQILSEGGEHNVALNHSLTLFCESDGYPPPNVNWTKDGRPVLDALPNMQILSDGQQLRISNALAAHKGQYMCTASNKKGSVDISFDVDIINPPSVVEDIRDIVEVVVNQSATLRCPLSRSRYSQKVQWLRDRQPLDVKQHKKYTESHNGQKLHLMNAQPSDEGNYGCRVRNQAGEKTVDMKVMVLEKPKILMLEKDKIRQVVENATVHLSCAASGKPDPTIQWFKDGEQVPPGVSVDGMQILDDILRIAHVKSSHSGRYTCMATNKVGFAEQDISLFVMTPSRIEREGISDNVEVVLKQRATLSCPAFGRPPPQITWLKSGRPLTASERVYFSANGQNLHLLSIDNSDLDKYTCLAKNLAGEDRRDFNVKVLIAPSISGTNLPRNLQIVSGRSVVIECPATGSPEPNVSWLKNGQPIRESAGLRMLMGGRQLQITSAKVEDSGRYTCIAINAVGVSDLDTFIDVVGPPMLEGGVDSETIEVMESQSVTLNCDITGTEPLEILWQKDEVDINASSQSGSFMQIASKGRKLHLLAARVNEEGRYTCVGRNRAGEIRKNIHLKVTVPPNVNESLSSPAVQKVSVGHSAQIDCRVNGVPRPKVTWRIDGESLDLASYPDNIYQLMNDNQTLLITKVSDSNVGRFTCVISNMIGSSERDFIVKLKGPPQFERDVEMKEVNVGDYVIFSCLFTSGSDKNEVTWLIDDRAITERSLVPSYNYDERRFEIREARLSDAGRFTCVVKNEAGEARKHFDLSVLDKPQFINIQDTTASIVSERPLVLDCSVSGFPKPTITWFKDGKEINAADGGQFLNDNQQYKIASASQSNAGRYTCAVENKAGRIEKDILVDVQMPPELRQTVSSIEVNENDTFSMECPVTDKNNAEVSWMKNELPVYTTGNVQISNNGRKLHIIRTQTSNSGRYKCIAKNEAGRAEIFIDVQVLVPPKILHTDYRTVEGIYDQTVKIECLASGLPEPRIEWMKDGRPILASPNIEYFSNGSILQLSRIRHKLEGRYTCIAINKAGKAEADTFFKVIELPRISKIQNETKVVLGQSQTLNCEAQGDPHPEVTWLKNGQSYGAPVLRSAAANNYFVHISNANLQDAGRYTCVARNKIGEDRHSTNLIVLVPPTIETGERLLNVIENRSITLQCIVEGIPDPVLNWYKDGKMLSGHHDLSHTFNISGSKLTIQQAQVSSAGRYSCEAKNEAGSATADFVVDVYVRPHFVDLKSDVKVIERDRAVLECNVESKPAAQITWFKAGRPLDLTSDDVILSPRGHRLMLPSARRADAGTYSCVAKNAAGENEASFLVTVLVPPYIANQIDQNPQVILGQDITIDCPVSGVPHPQVEWRQNNKAINFATETRYKAMNDNKLTIKNAMAVDKGRFTCHARNEAGKLDTDFALDVIAPPKFGKSEVLEYEVIEGRSITMDCDVEASLKPVFAWFKGESTLYLNDNKALSSDGKRLTVVTSRLSDAGRYTCKATNKAGTAEVAMILRVLVPPKIDKSNIIGNPLAILNRSISLECPASGFPPPTVRWFRHGVELTRTDERITYSQNNQTIRIERISIGDQGGYSCVAESDAGRSDQEYNLEVLVPPVLTKPVGTPLSTFIEGGTLTLVCPISNEGPVPEITWMKDGRPLDVETASQIRFSAENRRMHVDTLKLTDGGVYTCIASNRAGESQMDFEVEVLSPPHIDTTRTEPHPRVIVGQPVALWCPASGKPPPTIQWFKNGKDISQLLSHDIALTHDGQSLNINAAKAEDGGHYSCVAKNAAGRQEIEVELEIWVPPTVNVLAEKTLIPVGQSVSLTCDVEGNPEPVLQWSKDGQVLYTSESGAKITGNGRRFDIPAFRQVDAGRYTCTARNEAGITDDYKDLDILIPPEIRREGVDLNPRVPIGQTLTIHCEATGKPSPQVTWYKDDQALNPSVKINIAPGGVYLQVINADLNDKGMYKCEANNDAGEDRIVYKVEVVQMPRIGGGATVQVVEGEPAVLNCEVNALPVPSIMWQRNGQRVDNRGRYDVYDNALRINESRSLDGGIYVCVATNLVGTAQQAYTLEVLVPPKIISNAKENVTVPLGVDFELDCMARGYPEPTVKWWHANEEVPLSQRRVIEADGSLKTYVAEPKDEGVYKCERSNPAGTESKEYRVTVIRPPKIDDDNLRAINVTETSPVMMICQVEADPPPQIAWFKDEIPVSSLQNGRAVFEQSDSRLTINDTRLTDSGFYRCLASNLAGNASLLFRLNVGVPPKITPEPRIVVAANDSRAELPCEAVGHPQPIITWMRDTETIPESNMRGPNLFFARVRPENASVYTCRAQNWAGQAYHEVELAVLVPPAVYPERSNFTVKENNSITLDCNATGSPQPVITWFREPQNVAIASDNKKYTLSENTLTIHDVKQADEGYYRCIATNDGGVGVGYRKIDVPRPEWRILWVECDPQGRPIRTTYIPARGDVPSTGSFLLPWSSEQQDLPENGTANTLIRCLPNRDNRRQRHHSSILPTIPVLTELPKNQQVHVGDTVTLTCAAIGTPPPEIVWMHDGKPFRRHPATIRGRSVLILSNVQTNQTGKYMCIARNHKGSTRAVAVVRVKEPLVSLFRAQQDRPRSLKTISVLTCKAPRNSSGKVFWMKDGRIVTSDHNRVNVLDNGTLVLTDIDDDEAREFQCVVDRKHAATKIMEKTIAESKPDVEVTPRRITPKLGKSVYIHCNVAHSYPLTTRILWFHNNLPVIPQPHSRRVQIFHNHTLLIKNVKSSDRGEYKCVAYNSYGGSSDISRFIIEDIPTEMKGDLIGHVNGVKLKDADIRGRVVQKGNKNEIEIRLDRLPFNLGSPSRAMLSSSIAPCWMMASPAGDSKNGYQLTNGHFERSTVYQFDTGEKFRVQQKGMGLDARGYLLINVLVDGEMPKFPDQYMIAMDPYVEYLVQSGPGQLQGYGSSIYRVGPSFSVPYSWHHKIDYEPVNGHKLDSRAEKIRVSALTLSRRQFDDDGSATYSYEAAAESDNICPNGFEAAVNGMYCTDVDECETESHGCFNSAQCINLAGSYRCADACAAGYNLTSAGKCIDINECQSNSSSICRRGEECVNVPGSYVCKEMCRPGYRRSSENVCVDVDECAESTPPPCSSREQNCVNLIGSYKCFCQPGFVLMGTTGTCEDIDECAISPPVCQYGCQNTPGSYTCYCPTGLTLMPDRRTCSPSISYNHAKAPETTDDDRPSISCSDGYNWDGSSNCEESQQCPRNNPCQYECRRTNGAYHCLCPHGYTMADDGHNCEDIDECEDGTAQCFGDKVCYNQRGGYECLRVDCPESYTYSVQQNACVLPCLYDGTLCSEHKPNRIQVQLVSLPRGIRAYRDVLRLTAFDKNGRQLRRTHFSLTSNDELTSSDSTAIDAVPFSVRLVKGRGIVFTLKPLNHPKKYRLKIRATSYDETNHLIKYQTEFLVYITVSQHPF